MIALPFFAIGLLFAMLGVRLIGPWRSGTGSERSLGWFFLGIGVGVPLRGGVVAGFDFGMDPATLNLAGQACVTAALACLAHFVWRLFQPEADWARHLFRALLGYLVLQLVLFAVTGAYAAQSSPVHIAVAVAIAAVFGWAFVESLRYRRLLGRRFALGLADPVVVNRFTLWTLWTGALAVFPLYQISIRTFILATGRAPAIGSTAVAPENVWAVEIAKALIVALGPVVVVSTWLIFFPPDRYLGWVRARRRGDLA